MRRMCYLPIPSEYSLSPVYLRPARAFAHTTWHDSLTSAVRHSCVCLHLSLLCLCNDHISRYSGVWWGGGWWGDRVEKISFSADNNRYVESSIKCHSSEIQWRKSERGQWEWAHVHNRTIALTGPVTYQPHLSYPGYVLAQVNLMTHTQRTWFVCYAAVKRHFRDTPSTSLFLFSSHNSIGYTFTILLAP